MTFRRETRPSRPDGVPVPDITREITVMTEALRDALDRKGVELTHDILTAGAIAAFTVLTEPGMILAEHPSRDLGYGIQHRYWRVGRRVPRHLYALVDAEPSDNDIPIGTLDTPEAALAAVKAHNDALWKVEVRPPRQTGFATPTAREFALGNTMRRPPR